MTFRSELVVQEDSHGEWILDEPLTYRSKSGQRFMVPAGFSTDFASVPRVLWGVLPPYGKHTKAAVLHDMLYQTGATSRATADRIFFEAMSSLEVALTRRALMWAGVRIGGWLTWRRNRRREAELERKGREHFGETLLVERGREHSED